MICCAGVCSMQDSVEKSGVTRSEKENCVFLLSHTHTHTHTHIYIYVYILIELGNTSSTIRAFALN
jgi:hypothetical protein